MNDLEGYPVNQRVDDELSKRLSRLQPLLLPESIAPGSEEEVLRDLTEKLRLKCRLTRFSQNTFTAYWDAVLISILFSLLGWDLFRIIRWLLR